MSRPLGYIVIRIDGNRRSKIGLRRVYGGVKPGAKTFL